MLYGYFNVKSSNIQNSMEIVCEYAMNMRILDMMDCECVCDGMMQLWKYGRVCWAWDGVGC